MKVVFCIDDKPAYLTMLKVAVRTLRHLMGASTPCLCVYAGENAFILSELAKENIPVARYLPRLNLDNAEQHFRDVRGCFLKLELALVPELAAEDYALYCDADVMFLRPLDALFSKTPPYIGMAREFTAPFYHDHESLKYQFQGEEYTVPMPFPIWTYSSGVALFNLGRFRQRRLIDHFLAFCQQNLNFIGNLDQSLLNYYFGKRITKLEDCWNRPPYHADCRETAHIVHFHGAKPWEGDSPAKIIQELAINDFKPLSQEWASWLTAEERALVGMG